MSRSLEEIRTAMQKLEERLDRGSISEEIFSLRYQTLKEELAELQQTPLKKNTTQIHIVKLSDGVNCRQLKPMDILANHYRIMKEIGRGGMGIVYQGEDINFKNRERIVAIKVLPQHLSQISETLEDFKREFLTACQLVHQYICAMYEFGQDDETYFLVIEYLEGATLADILSRSQKYSLESALPIIQQMAIGLDFAHSRGVLHLDMKPGNIMITPKGQVKIMDFGLAQKLQPNTTHICLPKTFGTPLYLAPEQVSPGSSKVRPSTDLWSLGVIVYEMLTGDTPFQGNTIMQLSQSIGRAIPKPILHIPSTSWNAVAKALSKNPQDRFSSCHEFFEALSRFSNFTSSNSNRLSTQIRPAPPSDMFIVNKQHDVETQNEVVPKSKSWLWIMLFMFGIGLTVGILNNREQLFKWLNAETPHKPPEVVADPFESETQIPPALHQACWKENLWDFTVPEWTRLHPIKQGCYGRLYQIWYAKNYAKQPLEREFELPDTTIKITMRLVPPGKFLMGSPTTEPGRLEDETLHRVTISKPFWMAKTEITQAQWFAVMKKNPSYFANAGENAPVERVDWDNAKQFCDKIKMSLPTELQWEYACRAGTTGMSYLGDFEIISSHNAPKLGELAWYSGNSGVNYKDAVPSHHWLQREIPYDYSGTHPIAGKLANPWGFYDLLGNVAEWCQDWYDKYPTDEQNNSQNSNIGMTRIQRGGSWSHAAQSCRSATRKCSQRPDSIGLRVVKEYNGSETSIQNP